ncbi:MAG: hypothetical protein ACRDNW_15770 [Trebonia sp.]
MPAERFQYRIEIYYEAVLVGGLDGLTLDHKEVLEGRLFSPAAGGWPSAASGDRRSGVAGAALRRR